MSFGGYILRGRKAVPCNDSKELTNMFSESRRRVASTERDGYIVSTVFLGMDHRWGDGDPLLFETMVFNSGDESLMELYCDRYSTWEEAEAGHIKACKKFFTNYTDDDIFIDKI